MSSTNLPEISSLPSLPTTTQHAVIDTLFEPSQHLHNFANALFSQQQEPQQLVHSSYQDLIDAVGTYLSGLSTSSSSQDRAALFEILGSHPRLGEKSPTKLSELSKKEQANLNAAAQQTPGGGNADKDNGVAAAAAEEEEELRRLNGVYEETFPGLRYVVFVNGLGRDVILEDMRRRINRADIDLEVAGTIRAMCDIAVDRVRKLDGSS